MASIAIHDTDPAAGLESRVSTPATGILLALLLSAVFGRASGSSFGGARLFSASQ